MVDVVHKHMILRIEAEFPPTESELRDWIIELIDAIGMKLLAGPISADITTIEGNMGPTCVAVIETSHIACHVWNETSPALIQLDVYSCAELDIKKVLTQLDVWGPLKVEWKFLDRKHGLETIAIGTGADDINNGY